MPSILFKEYDKLMEDIQNKKYKIKMLQCFYNEIKLKNF